MGVTEGTRAPSCADFAFSFLIHCRTGRIDLPHYQFPYEQVGDLLLVLLPIEFFKSDVFSERKHGASVEIIGQNPAQRNRL